MVSDLLSVGKTSRFYNRLIYDDQIATGADAGVDLRRLPAVSRAGYGAAGPGTCAGGKELDEELARFLKDGPTDRRIAAR